MWLKKNLYASVLPKLTILLKAGELDELEFTIIQYTITDQIRRKNNNKIRIAYNHMQNYKHETQAKSLNIKKSAEKLEAGCFICDIAMSRRYQAVMSGNT